MSGIKVKCFICGREWAARHVECYCGASVGVDTNVEQLRAWLQGEIGDQEYEGMYGNTLKDILDKMEELGL